MSDSLLTLAGVSIGGRDALAAGGVLALALLLAILLATARLTRARALEAAAAAERQRELDDKMAELARMNAELAGRMRAMSEVVADRLETVSSRVGAGIEQGARATAEQLARLGERLAVIDRAQTSLSALSQEMVGLKHILSNKQTRGAFGQGRMEAIVRDGLPTSAFTFQATLSSGARPDCLIRLPGDERPLAVDAKFPLEAVTEWRDAGDAEQRKRASARVRADLGRHVRDIESKYLLPGETQDIALLFVPSEGVYADLQEHFDDIAQKASSARVILVSPSLLMMAIQLMQAIVRDARMRDQAHTIQAEVDKLIEDVTRLRERAGKLAAHWRQANDDVESIGVSAQKINRRADRIMQLEFSEAPAASGGQSSKPRTAPSPERGTERAPTPTLF